MMLLMLGGCGDALQSPLSPESIEDSDISPTLSDIIEAFRHHDIGANLLRQRHLEEAITEFDIAISLDPNFAVAYNNRGIAYKRLGQPERAMEDFNEVIRFDPLNAEAHALRAWLHTLLFEEAEAQGDMERALELGYDKNLMDQLVVDAKRER